MTASRIELFDYIEQLRSSVPEVHPSGQRMIHEWLGEMREAAACDDAATVARFARLITEKIEQEEAWARESLSTFDKHHGEKIIERERDWQWEYGVADDGDEDA